MSALQSVFTALVTFFRREAYDSSIYIHLAMIFRLLYCITTRLYVTKPDSFWAPQRRVILAVCIKLIALRGCQCAYWMAASKPVSQHFHAALSCCQKSPKFHFCRLFQAPCLPLSHTLVIDFLLADLFCAFSNLIPCLVLVFVECPKVSKVVPVFSCALASCPLSICMESIPGISVGLGVET